MKKSFKINELGRSMVEILGVLAIIGVLSIGGIQGYKYAMDKHRANDIVHSVNMRATDIWHLYQDGEKELPDSPDEDAFPEYGEMTQTGFEIMVTSHPPVAFRTWVNDVPSAVCQKVLQENLNDAIQGLKFVQVGDVDAENLIRYTGDTAICGESGTMNQMVFTSFLDEDGGAVSGITDPNNSNSPLQHCVDEKDCPQECGGAICEQGTMTCRDGCTGTDKPVCMRESGTCVECQTNDNCAYKGRGWICNETNYTCTQLQKTCPVGTFRSQNGACISCDDGSNFIVLKDGQPFPDTSDETDGYTMCAECEASGAKRWQGELIDDANKGYCSFMCTAGYSYQSLKEGCIPCSDMTPKFIAKDEVSKKQCLSCPNHAWYSDYWFDYYNNAVLCQQEVVCGEDEFITTVRASHYTCAKCNSSRNANVGIGHYTAGYSDSNFYQLRIDKCNNCPERDSAGNYSARWHVGNKNSGSCAPKCEQPVQGSEADVICQTNPFSEKCKRKWQNASGACFDCNEMTTSNNIKYGTTGASATDAELARLCVACGRKVDGNYCVLPQTKDMCGVGKFLGKDGNCYLCNHTTHIEIESDDVSGCLSNCKKSSTTATDYVLDGTIDTRRVYTMNNLNYCAPQCSSNQINQNDGKCVSCGDDKSLNAITPAVLDDCKNCPYRVIFGNSCSPKTCPTSYYKNYVGNCLSCSEQNPEQATFTNFLTLGDVASCNACGNRMAIKRYSTDSGFWCTYVNPGHIGICNSIGNTTLPDEMNEAIIAAAQLYISSNSQHDGEKFRDHYGYCRSCSDDKDYNSDKEQCLSCKNRRWSNNTCMKGLCEEKLQFLSDSVCLSCSNVNKPINPRTENLCSSCENRRQMEIGTPDTTLLGLCVEECAGAQWQDINGNCLFCPEGGDREIGTDTESRRLCNECDGLRQEQAIYNTDKTQIIGYKCVLKEIN